MRIQIYKPSTLTFILTARPGHFHQTAGAHMWLKIVTVRIFAVLRSYDAQEYQPTTVYTLYEGVLEKPGLSSWVSRTEVEAMKYGSARLAMPSD